MMVELSVYPLDKNEHLSNDVAAVAETLTSLGIDYEVGPMGTCLHGDWDVLVAGIKACHDRLLQGHNRLVMHITIDSRKAERHSIRGMVAAVNQKLSQHADAPMQSH